MIKSVSISTYGKIDLKDLPEFIEHKIVTVDEIVYTGILAIDRLSLLDTFEKLNSTDLVGISGTTMTHYLLIGSYLNEKRFLSYNMLYSNVLENKDLLTKLNFPSDTDFYVGPEELKNGIFTIRNPEELNNSHILIKLGYLIKEGIMIELQGDKTKYPIELLTFIYTFSK